MEVLDERCGGLDVPKNTGVACLCCGGRREVRTYSTVTRDLRKLGDWLQEAGGQCVARESTGVYWKPIFNLWEGNFAVLLVNAQARCVPFKLEVVYSKNADQLVAFLPYFASQLRCG